MSRWAALALGLLAACGSTDATDDDAGAADAGPDLNRAPSRPSVVDGVAGPEVVLVLNEIRWDQGSDWERIGIDLDGLVTIERDPSTAECVAPAKSAPASSDGVGGTDNALGQIVLPYVGPAYAERSARELQAMGIGALLVRVREWTGVDDDPLVTADLFATTGLDAAGSLLVAGSSVLEGDLEQPRARDDTAYVASRTLVMRLPDRMPLELAFGDGVLSMALTDATLVVRLGERATVAGRWSALDALAAAPVFGACDATGEMLFAGLVDVASDIRAAPGTGGPGVQCDAISVGIELSVAEATLGGVGPAVMLDPPCP